MTDYPIETITETLKINTRMLNAQNTETHRWWIQIHTDLVFTFGYSPCKWFIDPLLIALSKHKMVTMSFGIR